MRESFEVLDPQSTNAITPASLPSTLDQIGLPSDSSTIRSFFPPGGSQSLNLARYLDLLSGPMAELSPPDELLAALEAFDRDDSGQIDVGELRRALLETPPEDGDRLSEREVDAVMGEFVGRRAFGGKGVNVARGKGEVFRYREFMGAINGGGGDAASVAVA
jgi:Ca2+-binding EF-hand superfamily protein